MQRSWQEKNVDLALLTTRLGDFFKVKDFEAVKGEIPSGYQIFAAGSPYFRINGEVSVTVKGEPNDFTVDLELSTEGRKHVPSHSTFLESMIVGGYFFRRRLKSGEEWLRLEKEFWRHVENAVLQLSNSAKNPAQSSE